ncbi:unnamed protein product, partial [Mesorhabditis spiculigera]
MGLKLRLISLLPLLLLAGSSLAVHDEPTELEMTALPIDDASESAVDRNQKAVPLNPESAGEGAVHSPIVNQQMIQWGEHLAQVSSDEDKQLLAKLINRDPSILDRNGMFDLLKDWLRERNIVTELPPVLRDVLQIKDPHCQFSDTEVRPVSAAVANVLLKLNKGNRQWMNLGENDRQHFFEKVATNVVSMAIKSLAEAKRRSLEEVRKVLKESIVALEMYMLQDENPGYLAFEKKRQVAKELAKIAREGKVRTLDDAFFVADGLVSRITDELPEGN